MERKSKKILAGMMTGFSVLSTQSVLVNFQKLPMGGGSSLISYAEKEISGTKNESGSVSSYGFYVTSTSRSGGDMPDNRGVLQYKIDCTSDKSNFVVNTLLRNSGVTKADGKVITAVDLENKTSARPLQIKGVENFFKDKAGGGSDLAKFSLSADADSDLATELKKLNFTEEKVNEFYIADNAYLRKLDNLDYSNYPDIVDKSSIELSELKKIKAEAERLIPIAEACVSSIPDNNSQKTMMIDLLGYAKKFNNSITGDNLENLQPPADVNSGITNTNLNKGRLLFIAFDIAINLIQYSAYIAIDGSVEVDAMRNSNDYQNIKSVYDSQKNANADADVAFEELKKVSVSSSYSATDLAVIVCLDKYMNMTEFDMFIYRIFDKAQEKDSKFKFLAKCYEYAKTAYNINYQYNMLNNVSKCFDNDNDLLKGLGLNTEHCDFRKSLYLTDNLIGLIDSSFKCKVPCSFDLTLNTTPTTDIQTVQDGNTYQIFETTDQKLYWDSDKLVFEIPIELPEKTTDNSTITSFKLTCEENPEYLAVETTPAT